MLFVCRMYADCLRMHAEIAPIEFFHREPYSGRSGNTVYIIRVVSLLKKVGPSGNRTQISD